MNNMPRLKFTSLEWDAACAHKVEELKEKLAIETDENKIRFLNRQIRNWEKYAQGEGSNV